MSDAYVVAIKPSARRRNAAAAEQVGRRGSTRRFPSKSAAREWAASIRDGDGAVRIQDAAPNDPAPVDGYLVADPNRRRSASDSEAESSDRDLSSFVQGP